jgi:hypothetical protein
LVLAWRHRLKVVRINAVPNPTQMVEHGALGWLAHQQPVDEAVGLVGLVIEAGPPVPVAAL